MGYCVGRVEEVHSNSSSNGKKGGADILQRRLVRIYTPGTAVESYFDDKDVVSGIISVHKGVCVYCILHWLAHAASMAALDSIASCGSIAFHVC